MNPIYVSKTLVAASSTGIGTLSSASPGVATLNTSSLDTGRRISIASASGTLATAKFTITGTRENGGTVSETITGPTSVGGTSPAVATTSDFLSVTSVSASSVINTTAVFGTNTTGGTPWQSVNLHVTPPIIGAGMTFSSTGSSMVAQLDITMDYPYAPFNTPGGLTTPINAVPTVFQSTHWQSITSNNWDALNIQVNPGGYAPIAAWRLTLTSSSSSAGSVNVAVIQAGIG